MPGSDAAVAAGRPHDRRGEARAAGIELALPALERAAAAVTLDQVPVVLADYGCAHGRNAMRPMRAALRGLRARMAPDRPVYVVHIDQPDNDYAALFRRLEDDPESYLQGDPDAFPVAIGRSFFRPVLPPGSVTLGWSAYAAHWLSAVPVETPGHVYPRLAPPEARAAFRRQGEDDWLAFLVARVEELRPGGRLVVATPSTPEDWSDHTASAYRAFMQRLDDELGQMAAEGALAPAERARMVVPVFGRTLSELVAPFATDLLAQVELVAHEAVPQPDPHWDCYLRDRDPAALAERYADFFGAGFVPALERALDPARDAAAHAAFAARLRAGLHASIVAEPRRLLDYALITLEVVRH